MNTTFKKYLDLEGLQTYDELLKQRTDASINDAIDPIVQKLEETVNLTDELQSQLDVIATYSVDSQGEANLESGVVKAYVDNQVMAILDSEISNDDISSLFAEEV